MRVVDESLNLPRAMPHEWYDNHSKTKQKSITIRYSLIELFIAVLYSGSNVHHTLIFSANILRHVRFYRKP